MQIFDTFFVHFSDFCKAFLQKCYKKAIRKGHLTAAPSDLFDNECRSVRSVYFTSTF